MFPSGMYKCAEAPVVFYYYIYSNWPKRTRLAGYKKQYTGVCSGSAKLFENLPVGTYTLAMYNNQSMEGKKNSFGLTTWGKKSEAKLEMKKK